MGEPQMVDRPVEFPVENASATNAPKDDGVPGPTTKEKSQVKAEDVQHFFGHLAAHPVQEYR